MIECFSFVITELWCVASTVRKLCELKRYSQRKRENSNFLPSEENSEAFLVKNFVFISVKKLEITFSAPKQVLRNGISTFLQQFNIAT